MDSNQHLVVFEQPLNERIRTFLRLEFLFGQYEHQSSDMSMFGARSRLGTLIDILTVLGRSDLKKDILKDLNEQHAVLTRLGNQPGVDDARLDSVLKEITHASTNLQQLATQFCSSALRDNEFLMSVHSRSTIPGGTCAFDMPALHFWLSRGEERVAEDLASWFADLVPFAQAILLTLRLLRGSVPMTDSIAKRGTYIHSPQAACNLLRVLVPRDAGVFPEISAGAHRFTVRFMELTSDNERGGQSHSDIPFKIQCCAF